RWSCALEEKALKLTKNCSHSVSESLDNGQNVHYTNDGEYISKEGKNAVIHDAMYRWTLPAQYYFMKDTRYESDRLYTFANMAHHEIYELGCNYEQCGDSFGGVGEAVFACVYNKKAPKKTDLYQKGDKTGCASAAKVKDVCKMKEFKMWRSTV
ncbi:hypothetical protein OSTOST_17685, partial [Ostertagia ostertagi]